MVDPVAVDLGPGLGLALMIAAAMANDRETIFAAKFQHPPLGAIR